MIEHVVLFRLNAGIVPDDLAALVARLTAFAATLDGVQEYRIGTDLRARDGNDDLAIAAGFRDRAAMDAYLTAPEHLAILAEYGPRLVAEKHSVQFEVA